MYITSLTLSLLGFLVAGKLHKMVAVVLEHTKIIYVLDIINYKALYVLVFTKL